MITFCGERRLECNPSGLIVRRNICLIFGAAFMAFASVLDLIGNTPLLRLNEASKLTGCEIYGKAEFLNPGQSVKDRAALGIIRSAEAAGTLKPGGIVVEGTAGNTGIGLAMVCSALGYRCKIVMPRHHNFTAVAQRRADHSKANTRIACCAFNNNTARL